MPDKAKDFIGELMGKLPAGYTVSIPDVSVAWDLHRDVVQGWIDSGEVDAMDLGAGSRHEWRIRKDSLRPFLERRELGLRAAAERRISNRQLNLFGNATGRA